MGIFSRLFGRSELKRLRNHYNELLKQRDKEIADLQRDNEFLVRNAMEQARKREEIAEHTKRLLDINKGLKKKLEKYD